jgi:hypothetical protein
MKKTGPRESSLINKAHSGTIQLRMKTSTKAEIRTSVALLKAKKVLRWSMNCRKNTLSVVNTSLLKDRILALVLIQLVFIS